MRPERIPALIDYWQRLHYSRLFVWIVLPVISGGAQLLLWWLRSPAAS